MRYFIHSLLVLAILLVVIAPSSTWAQTCDDGSAEPKGCWLVSPGKNAQGSPLPEKPCSEKGYYCSIKPGCNTGTCQCAFGDFEAPFPGGPTGDVCKYTALTSKSPLVEYANFWAKTIIALTVALGIVMVVVGGYVYMTAGGSADRIGKSKNIIGMALLGIALALTAFVILNTISPQFASDIDEPALTSPVPTP